MPDSDAPLRNRTRAGARFILGGSDLSFLLAGARTRSAFLRGLQDGSAAAGA